MNIKTTWKENKHFESVSEEGHVISFDAAKDNEGTNKGQTPAETLVSALGGCMGITIMTTLENYEQPVEELTIDLKGEKSAEVPKSIEKIHFIIRIKTDIPKKIVERVAALSHDKYCTISNSINAKTTYEIDYL